MDDTPQIPASDGERCTRAAAGRSGSGRHVGWWYSGESARKAGNSKLGKRRWSLLQWRNAAAQPVALEWPLSRISKAPLYSLFLNKTSRLVLPYTHTASKASALHETGFKHVPRSQPLRVDLRKGAKSVVPLADRAIGNLQQWLIGTYHGVSRDQLQIDLDEFVFRHNRRRLPRAADLS